MSTIHQIYCTHCTHGSSALEQREGELAQRTFGYSVRAGSLDSDGLRRRYQQVEPLVYYYLPSDTPDERKLDLSAVSAPRRFFFVPSAEGMQVAGQVCYRATDSEGRPGSYFAHLVLQDEEGAVSRWSPTEVLRLWGAAGWVAQDSSEIPFKLEPLLAVSELLGGAPAAIDDPVLVSFLRDPADSPGFSDPAGVIPERWRAMGPAVRRDWFLRVFSAFLHGATSDRRPLVVVVEPSVAALVFYGVLRLLPPGALRDETGFSTFEPDPDRAGAFLAATWFHDPQSAARPEACPWQRTTINTLLAADAQPAPPASKFAETIVQRLLAQGSEELDAGLKTMATVRVSGARDLDTLVEIDRAVDSLLESGAFPAAEWRNWPAGVEYLRQKLGQRLAVIEDLEGGLKAIAGGNAHLTAIDLLTAKPRVSGARQAVVHLLKAVPAEKILGLLKLAGVPDEDKITVLLRHIHAHGDLPPGCEFLWDEWAAGAEQPRRAGVVLMARAMAKLPPKAMERFAAHVPPQATHGFLLNCLKMVRQKKMKLASLTAMLRAASDEAVLKLVQSGGKQFLATYPKNEPAMGERMRGLLRSLAKHPDDFKQRLDLVLSGEHLMADEASRTAAACWDQCHKKIVEVGRLQDADANLPTEKRQSLMVAACRDMAMAADKAMTSETMDGEYEWSQKRDFLLKIGQRVLGGTPLFLPGAWESTLLLQRIDTQFQHHRFPTDPLKKEDLDKKKGPPRRLVVTPKKSMAATSRWLMIGIFAALAAITVGATWGVYLYITYSSSSSPSDKKPKGDPRRRARKKQTAFHWENKGDRGRRETPVVFGTVTPLARFGRGAGGEAALQSPDEDLVRRPLTAEVAAGIPALVREAVLRSG